MANAPNYGQIVATEADRLREISSKSIDVCVIAHFIALADSDVQQLVIDRLTNGFEFQGVVCLRRSHHQIGVVFNFTNPPGAFSVIPAAFCAIVDLELARVIGIQDPYIPMPTSNAGCQCAELRGNNCGDKKRDLQQRFDHVEFGSCDHPTPATADVEAAILAAEYTARNPRCIRDTETGHKTVKNDGPFGSSYHTYLAFHGCKDI